MSKERRLYPRYTLTSNLHILITPIGLAPRGCKVVDFSRGGMLLESQARKDELPVPLDTDLTRGETAEVSFVDATLPSRPKFSLNAQVVRVSDSHVAVYFVNASKETIDRLEQVVMRHVEHKPKPDMPSAKLSREGSTPPQRVRVSPPPPTRTQFDWNRWLIPVASLASLLVLAAVVLYVLKLRDRIDSLEDTLVAAVQARGDGGTVLRDVRNELGVLSARIEEAGGRINELKERVVAAEARPVDASDTEGERGTQQKQLEAVSDLVGKLAVRVDTLERQRSSPAPQTRPATAPQTGDVTTRPVSGPWVVHLISSVDPGVIARMKDRAQGILKVELNESAVTVKGHRVNRLSASGFASRAEAEAFAAQAMARLGLRDKPWVARN